MSQRLLGGVHGRTIELDEDPGMAEGQEVENPYSIQASGPESEVWVGPDGATFPAPIATVGGSHSEVYLRNHGVGSTWTMPVSVP